MIIDEKLKNEVEMLWEEVLRISHERPSIVFEPDEEDVEKFELLVKLGKMVKNKYGSGYSIRNDISGVYGQKSRRKR